MSIEDSLIIKYHEDHPGTVYKEFKVGKIDNKMRLRRIDAILIEGEEDIIYEQGEYKVEEVRNKVRGSTIHLIEAKKSLGRYVIGQVEVGKYLFKHDFNPQEVIPIALCARSHSDMVEYCNIKDIKVKIYKINNKHSKSNKVAPQESKSSFKDIDDNRGSPNNYKYSAFKRGWNDAIKGKLYDSIKVKKTHANMGNLFGWIYGDCPDEMIKKVWDSYIENNNKYFDKEW